MFLEELSKRFPDDDGLPMGLVLGVWLLAKRINEVKKIVVSDCTIFIYLVISNLAVMSYNSRTLDRKSVV